MAIGYYAHKRVTNKKRCGISLQVGLKGGFGPKVVFKRWSWM